MTRRQLLLASLFAQPARPNVVLILADDLGWADLGCYGSRFYETPHLDRFAATAMRFTQAYSACPVCSPTRASLMTGKYPARLGLTDYLPGLQPTDKRLLSVEDLDGLPREETTIAEALKAAGYRTFTRGKWHLGPDAPAEHGFDTPLKGAASTNKARDAAPTEDCLRFLEESGREPFFAYLAFTYPHLPVNAVPAYVERFEKKLARMNYPPERLAKERRGHTRLHQDGAAYASMLAAMDELCGRVFAKLDELQLASNTIVIFLSDNGGLCTHQNPNGGPTSNAPLRAGKGWCYEGGVRIPMLVRAPGVTRAGAVNATPVITTDLYPTLLSLLGLPARPAQHRDGVDLTPALRGGRLAARNLYWHYPHHHGSAWAPGAALRQGDWKLIEFYEEGTAELYHLGRDPGERQNLAATEAKKCAELRAALARWQKDVGAKMPAVNPAYKASQ